MKKLLILLALCFPLLATAESIIVPVEKVRKQVQIQTVCVAGYLFAVATSGTGYAWDRGIDFEQIMSSGNHPIGCGYPGAKHE